MDKKSQGIIRKYAIKNAIDYGKASVGSVLGKSLSMMPDAKSRINEIKAEVERVINEVNALPKDRLAAEYKKHQEEFAEEYKEKVEQTSKPKMVLEGAVEGKFAIRYAPAPSGYMHIGHTKAAFLATEFAKIYKGKVFLYFDDTNPEKDRKEYVDAIKKDLKWLGLKFDDEYYSSDGMEAFYGYARQLIDADAAYVCMCSAEAIKKDRFVGRECKHRGHSKKENAKLFSDMVANKYDEGQAILRFKGSMDSQNTALRDPTLMRIKKDKHYRQGTKYVVWPNYDMSTPINDSVHGITDAVRTKEYELRDELDAMILDALKLRKPRIHSDSRLVIKNNITHKRELNELISKKIITGWDDPRLVTLAALKKRGIQPAAIKEFALRFGMSKTDSVVDIEMLLAENKKILDPVAKHLFYVENPVKLMLDADEEIDVAIKVHPSKDMGERAYKITDTVYISGADTKDLKAGEVIRLKDLFNIEITKAGKPIKAKMTDVKGSKSIQWVPETYIECSVLVPENPLDDNGKFIKSSIKTSRGYVEGFADDIEEKEVVQFERFGFCILHDKKNMQFIFSS
ncbi:MAG: glutamate--tRNA ligase [Candidatus Micrarchaeota archaeon]|nr:glutamate--tRNA ligase [Candidatus Micrarchaeota archaeon]